MSMQEAWPILGQGAVIFFGHCYWLLDTEELSPPLMFFSLRNGQELELSDQTVIQFSFWIAQSMTCMVITPFRTLILPKGNISHVTELEVRCFVYFQKIFIPSSPQKVCLKFRESIIINIKKIKPIYCYYLGKNWQLMFCLYEIDKSYNSQTRL